MSRNLKYLKKKDNICKQTSCGSFLNKRKQNQINMYRNYKIVRRGDIQ